MGMCEQSALQGCQSQCGQRWYWVWMTQKGSPFDICSDVVYTPILPKPISQHLCCYLGSSCLALEEEITHHLSPEPERPLLALQRPPVTIFQYWQPLYWLVAGQLRSGRLRMGQLRMGQLRKMKRGKQKFDQNPFRRTLCMPQCDLRVEKIPTFTSQSMHCNSFSFFIILTQRQRIASPNCSALLTVLVL